MKAGRRLGVIAFVALVLTGLTATSALATRDKNTHRVEWQYSGGRPTEIGQSQDSPKRSNAYEMQNSYVAPYNYWEMQLRKTSFGFSYASAQLTGPGQVYWTVILEDPDSSSMFDPDYNSGTDNSFPATIVALDPWHCPGETNHHGWATVDFQQLGDECTIYTTTGTGPYVGDGTHSAWQKLLAEHGTDVVYFSYLIHDGGSPDPIAVDRVKVSSNVLSLFTD